MKGDKSAASHKMENAHHLNARFPEPWTGSTENLGHRPETPPTPLGGLDTLDPALHCETAISLADNPMSAGGGTRSQSR